MLESLIIFASLFGLVAIQASSDAIARKKKGKFWGWAKHIFTMLAIPAAVYATIARGYNYGDVAMYSASYVMLRLGFFNPIYNKVMKQPWYKFGTTKYWDRFNQWLMAKSPFKPPEWSLQGVYTLAGIVLGLFFTKFWTIIDNARNMF